MEESRSSQNKHGGLHIAMLPWLAHGHVMPFFELSKMLARKGHKISFVSTPKNLNRFSNNIPPTLSSLITLVPLPLPHVHGLPEGAESTSDLPIHRVPFLKKAYDRLQPALTTFLATAAASDHAVTWIVHDFASHWICRLAAPFGVHLLFFSIFCATTMLFFGSPEKILSGSRTRPEDFTVPPPWMGKNPDGDAVAYKLYEMLSHWDCMDSEVSDFQRLAEAVGDADAVVVRSCPEFESDSLIGLGAIYGKPVLPAGLLPPSPEEYGEQLRDERFGSLRAWLDGRDPGSVVYIAFGTEVSLSPESTHELASGVEKSRVPFVWVVNDRKLVEGASDSDIIPPGFESRVAGRGLVWRGWAPQVGVLAHPAVGGFMTHCGWSSVVEALALGRALVLFPGGSSDLGLVARLLNGRGIGLEVPRVGESGLFDSESVAESIRRVMVDPAGEAVREKARAMREIFGNLELQNKYLEKVGDFVVNN